MFFLNFITDTTWTIEVHSKKSTLLELQAKQCIQDFTWVTSDEDHPLANNLIPLKTENTVIGKVS